MKKEQRGATMTRIRFRFARGKELCYLSHLDMLRLFQRAMRRAALPLAFTQGFSPRPRFSLAAPLPVGATAAKEYGEVDLAEPLEPVSFLRRLGEQLPAGLALTGAVTVPPGAPSLAAEVYAALYHAFWREEGTAPPAEALQEALDRLLAQRQIMVRRPGRKGQAGEQDIRPFIFSAGLLPPGENGLALRLLLQVGSKGGLAPFRLLEQLLPEAKEPAEHLWRLHRQGLYIYRKETLAEPFPEGGGWKAHG